jgi:hypothetical protein
MIPSNTTVPSLHERNARRLIEQGKSPAEVAAYLDAMGVPRKKAITIERDPGQKWEDQAKSFLGSAVNSLTLGFGDEGIGSLYGLITKGSASEGVEAYRAGLQQAQQLEPGYATAGTIAGAALPAIASGGLGASAGLAGRMGAGAAVGGGMAAGQAVGDATGSMGDRATAGILPGMVGGVLGGALPGVGALAKGVLRPLASKVNILSKIPGVGNASQQADALLHRALERDGMKLDDLVDQARRAADQGAPLTLADIGGENVRGLMAAAAAVPGKAKQGLTQGVSDRQAGQRGRLLGEAQAGMKLGLENVYALKEKLVAQRMRDAKPLYDAAYTKSVDVDGALQQALDNPEFQRAYTLGKSIAAIEGVELPPLFTMVEDATGNMVKTWTPQLPVQALDYMKRGLNKRITAAAMSKAGVDRTAGHHLRERLEGILQIVDKQVPEYGIARSFFKGESEVIEALDLGRSFGKMRPDAVAGIYGPMSTAEKEMARTGFLEALEGQMNRNTAHAPDIAKTVFGSPDAIGRVKVLFGDAADDMIDAIRTESAISRTAAKMNGSRTAVLGKEMDDMDGGAEALGAVISMNPGSMVRALGRAVGNRGRTGWTEEVSDELAKRFQAGLQDPTDLRAMLLLMGKPPKARGIGPLPGLVGQGIGQLGS